MGICRVWCFLYRCTRSRYVDCPESRYTLRANRYIGAHGEVVGSRYTGDVFRIIKSPRKKGECVCADDGKFTKRHSPTQLGKIQPSRSPISRPTKLVFLAAFERAFCVKEEDFSIRSVFKCADVFCDGTIILLERCASIDYISR